MRLHSDSNVVRFDIAQGEVTIGLAGSGGDRDGVPADRGDDIMHRKIQTVQGALGRVGFQGCRWAGRSTRGNPG